MLRSLLTVLLATSALAATAQTAPRRAAKPATTTANTKPVPTATSDATATDGSFGNGAPSSSSANDGGQGQGVYAAPGMAVDIKKGKVEPYNSTNQKPGDKPAKRSTTLSPK